MLSAALHYWVDMTLHALISFFFFQQISTALEIEKLVSEKKFDTLSKLMMSRLTFGTAGIIILLLFQLVKLFLTIMIVYF